MNTFSQGKIEIFRSVTRRNDEEEEMREEKKENACIEGKQKEREKVVLKIRSY